MLDHLPILGICGWSGAGKTTLIEELLPVLRRRGLAVAAVKHDAHGLDVDRPGKDSDRLFRAGASVLVQGPNEAFSRTLRSDGARLLDDLRSLAHRHDLVLVEGHKRTPLPKLWLLGPDEEHPPGGIPGILAVLPRGPGRLQQALDWLTPWLHEHWLGTPVGGCVLIGGRSSRMGTPKQLLPRPNGQTWLERTVALLRQVTGQVAIAGTGAVPSSLHACVRLPDVPDAAGPMAGILAALRWAPQASWLVAACDLPHLSLDALRWLLATRAPGTWATLPRLPHSPGVEPLLAHFDVRSRPLLERLAVRGDFCPARIVGSPHVRSPHPPAKHLHAWRNVNTPEELTQTV